MGVNIQPQQRKITMLKYAIAFMFIAGAAFAQQQAPAQGASQPAAQQAQPGQAAAPVQAQAPANAPQGNAGHVAARNASIQQIEQALQQLRQSNQ
jgi:hypothetical protein